MIRRAASVITIVVLNACSSGQQNQAQQSVKSGLLSAAVEAKLTTIDVDAPGSVRVSANDGTITLTGEAKSAQERRNYDAAARSVSGVTKVVDRLSINPHLRGTRQTLADTALGAQVSAAIAAQAGVNVFHVKTSVHSGVVTLTGTVPTMAVKQTVIQAARSTHGVGVVIDRLRVER